MSRIATILADKSAARSAATADTGETQRLRAENERLRTELAESQAGRGRLKTAAAGLLSENVTLAATPGAMSAAAAERFDARMGHLRSADGGGLSPAAAVGKAAREDDPGYRAYCEREEERRIERARR